MTKKVLDNPALDVSPPESGRSQAFADLRRCYICERVLPIASFPLDATKSTGRMYRCRSCDNQQRVARIVHKPPRPCVTCGGPTPSARHSYCDRCRPAAARARERRRNRGRVRPSSSAQGYGYEHKKLRKKVARIVEAGLAVCWRCGKPLVPGQPWMLGHDDEDRSVYRGPECVPCNCATAGRRKPAASRRW